MTKEEQKAFVDGCQERLRGYVSNWMRDPFFRGAFHYRRDAAPAPPPTTDNSEAEPERRVG